MVDDRPVPEKMRNLSRSLCLGLIFTFSLCFGETLSPPAETVSDYVRFVEGSDKDLLQTAVTRFQKGDISVDLVAVVHLADGPYFENLNDFLATYDLVFYEMVGGPFSPSSAGDLAENSEEMAGIRQLQTLAKSFLGLEFQLEGINYEAANFVHADVEWQGLTGLMESRNQNFTEIFTRAMALSQEGSIPGLPEGEAGMSLMLGNLMAALTTGNSTELKRLVAPMLSEAEKFITQLEGDDGTVLVTERNKVVMEKLDSGIQERGAGKYAVFYGAGHMPDLEKRLMDRGFVKGETGWVDAWSLDHAPATAGQNPAVAPGDFLLKLLQDNPEIMGTIQQLGEVIEQLQPAE